MDRARCLVFGLVGGALLSAARAPGMLDLFSGPIPAATDAALFRGAAWLAIGLALLARGARGRDDLGWSWLVGGAGVGFVLHALFLPRSWVASQWSELGWLVLAGLGLLVLLRPRARNAALGRVDAPARLLGLALAALGASVALHALLRPVAMIGELPEDRTIFAVVFAAAVTIGTISFGAWGRGERGSLVLGLGLVLLASSCALALAIFEPIASRDGLDRFLRAGLLGRAGLDLSARSTLAADLLIGSRVFFLPGLVAGLALAGLASRAQLAALALGAAAGELALALWIGEPRVLPLDELGRLPADYVRLGSLTAAGGAALFLADRSTRGVVAALSALALGAGPWFLERPVTLPIAPWDRFTPVVEHGFESPEGMGTLEPTRDFTVVALLARTPLADSGREARAGEQRLSISLDLARGGHGAETRVLLVGLLTPERWLSLSSAGVAQVDRTSSWHRAMPLIEERLFEGQSRPAGEVLSPASASLRLSELGSASWDLIVVEPIEGVAFDAPSLPCAPEDAPLVVVWSRASSGAAWHSWSGGDWRAESALASDGFEELCCGLVSRRPLPTEVLPSEVLRLGETEPTGSLFALAQSRTFDRNVEAHRALARRLEAGAGASRLAEALRLHWLAQVHSSMWESRSLQIEFEPRALDLLREEVLARRPGRFLRNWIDDLAQILVEKREIELIASHLGPMARAWPVWPMLELALAHADLEALDPKSAANHYLAVLQVNPHELNAYLPAARALMMANEPAQAAGILAVGLKQQPGRRDFERELAMAEVRAGIPGGVERARRLLEETPEDRELELHLGPGPYPPIEVQFAPFGHVDAHGEADHAED